MATITGKDIARRAANGWFSLAYLALFGYLDWITHRSLPFVIIVGGLAAALMLFPEEIADKLNIGSLLDSIPRWTKPFLFALPGLVYFVTRGQGTSGAGSIVVIGTLGAVAGIAFFGREIDERLLRFYAVRDKILPSIVRYILAVVVPIFLSFLIIHGNLADLPAMWGGESSSPKRPTGLDLRFFVSVVLAAGLAFLLTRDPETAEPAPAAQPDVPVVESPPEKPLARKPKRRPS